MPPPAVVLSWGQLRRAGLFPVATTGSCSHSYRCAVRVFGYSAYDSIRKPPKRCAGSSSSPATTTTTPTGGDGTTSIRRRSGAGMRPAQSPTEKQREAKQIFPETLKSGRYKQQSTRAQRLYEGPASPSASAADTRFFRKLEDYREVQDSDPYASVFGEKVSVERRRVKEWQRQFEEENADVELPYERTNILARLAPNWFVRCFVNMRDRGGAESTGFLWAIGISAVVLLWLVGYLFYTPPSKAKPIAELR
ncbi:hypothetical protein DQ04_15051010 [Trypanosoma grayi]|uniref:hypothetical protein n=1 Tax=Trypanosoma grayi TaxID=71804 RepID=UPI0004F45EE9|nr:hypothetical protein DQ04_15051010 [Trypanosoma grayi]KEG06244.1 hypothetical protein DQ04_15051010 [Trypanosoma grayi]